MKVNFATRVVLMGAITKVSTEILSPKRAEVQAEINSFRVVYDKNRFKKTDAEKKELKLAKSYHKENPSYKKDEILRAFIDSKMPNWGSLNFVLL